MRRTRSWYRPSYFLLAGANLVLVAVTSPGVEGIDPRRVLRESGLLPLPVELLNALMAAAVVLVWAHAGLAAAALALLVLLIITVPLLRVVSVAVKSVRRPRSAPVVSCWRPRSVSGLGSQNRYMTARCSG